MPAGLQIFNASGQIMLDTSDRIGRVKGMVRAEGVAGSYAVDMSDGTPWWSFQPDQMYFHISNVTPPPNITINSTGISWTYSSTSGLSFPNPIKGLLILGVY